MEEGEGQGNVVTDADLGVEGERCLGPLQELSQAVVHQLHQQHREVGDRSVHVPRYWITLG